MHLNDRVTRLSRRTAAMFAIVPAALLVAGLASGVAAAAPGDDITDDCLEMSQGVGTWLAPAAFAPTFTDYVPVPGDEGLQLAFNVRNKCDVPATLVVYSENWSVADNAAATVRGAINGQTGQQVVIGPGKDATTRIELAKKPVTKNTSTLVEFFLGIPSGEVVMGNEIDGGWSVALIEDEAPVAAPDAPTSLTLSATEAEAGTPVRVSGNAEPGSAVTVSGGGATCSTAADATTGAFSCELKITTPGDHPISATAKNAGGSSQASTAVSVKVTPVPTDPTDPGDEGTGSLGSSTGSLGSLDFLGSLGG